MKSKVRISGIPNTGDIRGSSFTIPGDAISFLGRVLDIHLATIVPGATRGNHFHLRRREALIITSESAWKFYWDEGEETPVTCSEFSIAGTCMILIEPGSSHAVQNNGDRPLFMVGLSSETYDPGESISRKLV